MTKLNEIQQEERSSEAITRPLGVASDITRPGHIQKPGHITAQLTDVRNRLAYIQSEVQILEDAGSPFSPVVLGDGLQFQAIHHGFQMPRPIHKPGDLTIVPDTSPCRPQSTLNLFPQIFTDYSAPSAISQDVGITFFLNPAQLILPTTIIQNCTWDAMFGVPALFENISLYSDPLYILNPVGVITQILFVVQPTDTTKPLKFGFRIRYEENAAITRQFNPKKKAGQVMVPKPSFFQEATEQA